MADTKPALHPTPPLPPGGHYRIDARHSSVTFRTRHLFGLAGVSGSMQVAGGDISFDSVTSAATVHATVNAASFDTGNAKRDHDVRSAKFLSTADHPEIVFNADALRQTGDGWSLDGRLTVRGITKPVTLDITTVRATKNSFRVTASARVDRYAFGITAARGMAARHVHVTLTITAKT